MAEITILDVGHGNSAVVSASESNNVVVLDAAPGETLLDTLRRRSVTSVESVLVSHADRDHVGGLLNLLTNIPVGAVYINRDDLKRSRKIWLQIRSALALARQSGRVQLFPVVSSNVYIQMSDDLAVRVHYPFPEMVLEGTGHRYNGVMLTSNTMSGIFGVEYRGSTAALFFGDIDSRGLDLLASKWAPSRVELLVFPHHGGVAGGERGAGEMMRRLARMVTPRRVVFSTGRGRYDNPRPEIVEAVRQHWPHASIACTQLSERCASDAMATPHFLNGDALPSAGHRDGSCCLGSIRVDLVNGGAQPEWAAHRNYVERHVPVPLCIRKE